MKYPKNHKFLMSAFSVSLAASAVVTAAPGAMAAQSEMIFTDVKSSDHFYEAVKSLQSRHIIKGYEDGTFRPYAQLTRAQAAKIIALTLNLDTADVSDPGYKDVSKTSPEYGYIAALANKGIVKGYGDRFRPNEPLTRAQMAKMIVLAFNLEQSSLKDSHFKDVNSNDWYAGYVQSLIEKEITVGTAPDTFSPTKTVTRGQMASFIYRSESAVKSVQVQSAIVNITNQEIVTEEGSYKLSADLKTWLNSSSLSVLKGAVINFNVKNNTVEKVNAIELTAAGKVSADTDKPQANHMVFDGKGAVIQANVIMNGDYTTLKDVTIKGDLHIGQGVKNSFYTERVTVEGKTSIADTEAMARQDANKFYKSLAYKMDTGSIKVAAETAANKKATIVFSDSQFQTVEVSKNDIVIESRGTSAIDSVTLSGEVTFRADDSVVIPKIVIGAGVSNVVIDSTVQELAVVSNQYVTIAGNGSFGNITASNESTVSVQTTGKIDTLATLDKESKFILSSKTKVDNLSFPSGAKASDVIQNYNTVKNNIEQIDGKKNPDTQTPSRGGGSGGGSSSQNHSPSVANEVSDQTATAGAAPFTVDLSNVFTDEDGDALTLTAQSSNTGVATVSITGNTLTIAPINAGTATITVTANDGRGGTKEETFTITVEQPNRLPVVANGMADQTATAGDTPFTVDLSNVFTDEDGDALTLTPQSSNTGVATVSITGNTLTIAPINAGTATITVTANDGRGGTKEEAFTVTVAQPNRLPVVANGMTDQTATAGDTPFTVDLSNVFTDEDGDALTLTAQSSNTGVATVSITGNTLTIAPINAGTATITVTANDGRGGTKEETFTITVAQPNRVPVVANGMADQTATAGAAPFTVDLSNVFTDADNDALTLTAQSSDTDVATATVTGTTLTINPINAGTTTIKVTANDGRGGTKEETFTITVEQPNQAPEVTASIPGQTKTAGDEAFAVNLAPVFEDAEDGDNLTLDAVSSTPGVASVSIANGLLTVTPLNAGTTNITITATDSKGEQVTQAFTMTVQPRNEAPEVTASIADQTKTVGDEAFIVDLAPVFEDAEDGDNLTLDAVSSTPGVASVSIANGLLTVTPLNAGTTNITITATDSKGEQVTQAFTMTVQPRNEAPEVTASIADQTKTVGDEAFIVDLAPVFEDAEDGDNLTLDAVSSTPGVASVSIANGLLTVTPLNAGTATITVTAGDGNGGTVSSTFTVTVEETPAVEAPNVFISQTIWGEYDLAFEIYNPTSSIVDLSEMKIVLPDKEINLDVGGKVNLQSGEAFAVVDEWFFLDDPSYLRVPFDIDPGAIEAVLPVTLMYGDQVVDSIEYKPYVTLVRNSDISKGRASFDISEWTEYPKDSLDDIGAHTHEPASSPEPVNEAASLAAGSTVIKEALANDGSITDKQVVTLSNGTFAADVIDTDITINNLPAGLGYTVARDSDTQLTITFTEKATDHADKDDVSNVSVTIDASKISGASSDVTTGDFAIDYEDPETPENN